jgi:hypothetical protein
MDNNNKNSIKQKLKAFALSKHSVSSQLEEDSSAPVFHSTPALLNEAQASLATQQAKAFGLEYYGFDRWGKNGVATHIQNSERTMLFPLKKRERIVKSADLKKKNIQLLRHIAGSEYAPKEGEEDHDPEIEKRAKEITGDNKGNFASVAGTILRPQAHYPDPNSQEYKYKFAVHKQTPLNRYDIDALIKHSKEQYDKLNRDEKNALADYTGSGHSSTNSTLRSIAAFAAKKGEIDYHEKTNFKSSHWKLKKSDNTLHNMSSAFDKFKLDQEIVVYRGSQGSESDFLKEKKVGDILDIQNYISSSVDPTVAKNFGDGKSLLIIRVPKGSKASFIAGFSEHTTEAEVILDRGMQLRLIEIRRSYSKPQKDQMREYLKDKNGENPTDAQIMSALEGSGGGEYGELNPTYRFKFDLVGHKRAISTAELGNINKFVERIAPSTPEDLERARAEKEHIKQLTIQAKKEAAAEKKAKLKHAKIRGGGFLGTAAQNAYYSRSYSLNPHDIFAIDNKDHRPAENTAYHHFLRVSPHLKPLVASKKSHVWQENDVASESKAHREDFLINNHIEYKPKDASLDPKVAFKYGLLPIKTDKNGNVSVHADEFAKQKIKPDVSKYIQDKLVQDYANLIKKDVTLKWGKNKSESKVYSPTKEALAVKEPFSAADYENAYSGNYYRAYMSEVQDHNLKDPKKHKFLLLKNHRVMIRMPKWDKKATDEDDLEAFHE